MHEHVAEGRVQRLQVPGGEHLADVGVGHDLGDASGRSEAIAASVMSRTGARSRTPMTSPPDDETSEPGAARVCSRSHGRSPRARNVRAVERESMRVGVRAKPGEVHRAVQERVQEQRPAVLVASGVDGLRRAVRLDRGDRRGGGPVGNAVCYGSYVHVVHQAIQHLRTGTYGGGLPRFRTGGAGEPLGGGTTRGDVCVGVRGHRRARRRGVGGRAPASAVLEVRDGTRRRLYAGGTGEAPGRTVRVGRGRRTGTTGVRRCDRPQHRSGGEGRVLEPLGDGAVRRDARHRARNRHRHHDRSGRHRSAAAAVRGPGALGCRAVPGAVLPVRVQHRPKPGRRAGHQSHVDDGTYGGCVPGGAVGLAVGAGF